MSKTIIKKIINDSLNKLKAEIIENIKEYNKFYELKDQEIFDEIDEIFNKYKYV
jgi:hypothetical protein